MKEQLFYNCRVITEHDIVNGHVLVRDGRIAAVEEGNACGARHADDVDMEGDYLAPGLVELHTDNLEKHILPRPKVVWPQPESAFFAHDAQIVSSGITTVFDALSVGEYHDKGRIAMLGEAVEALNHCRESGQLRAEHLLHLRCEVADPRMQELFFPISDTPGLHLVSLMDHTPGQRQWRNTESYRTYYSNTRSWTDDEFQKMVDELRARRDSCADENAASVMSFCRDYASENGMTVLMGAPNIVRGGSHSGNVSAETVAREGYLGALSSDYVPISLISAVFSLNERGIMPLPEAMNLVSSHPAEAVGLDDRGRIAEGLRADLVRIRRLDDVPVVRNVWREGERVF